jgi:hypothetical protein
LVTTIITSGVLLASGQAGPTSAAGPTEPREAQAAAERAATAVSRLEPRLDAALDAYEQALDGIAGRVSAAVTAAERADAAQTADDAARGARVRRMRSIYMSGGVPSLYATVLQGRSTQDALRRLAYVRSVVRGDLVQVGTTSRASGALQDRADELLRAADTAVVTASDVGRRAGELEHLLAEAQRQLAALDTEARRLSSARAAGAVLTAARARAGTATAVVTGARAGSVPADYSALYAAAAETCPGLPWTVLAAVGQVESGHGVNTGPSSAGAQGPMQFMPATFAAYAVDGDGDGDKDIADPADSIHSAAAYLCASGAGDGPGGVRRALFAYNHAQWYVDLVLAVAHDLASEAG